MTRSKKLTIFIVVMLAMLAIGGIFAIRPTLARYTTQNTGSGGAFVAKYVIQSSLVKVPVAGETATESTVLDVNKIQPGQTLEFDVQVQNFNNSAVCDVAQNYTISIETTGNLPLVYSLIDSGDAEQFVSNNTTSEFLLEAHTSTQHTYTLQISWPMEQNGFEYMHEVDKVEFVVSAYQTNSIQ